MKKLLLKGTQFFALVFIMASCIHNGATEVSLDEKLEENTYENHRKTPLDNDIQHQLQVFTAGKVWLERSETASIAGSILIYPLTKSF